MFKIDEQTGFIYYSIDVFIMMLNVMHSKCGDEADQQLPWDYIMLMLENIDNIPQA